MGSMSDHFNKSSVGSGGIGLLKHAVENGNMEVVKLLLGQGADINQPNNAKSKPFTRPKPKLNIGILPPDPVPSDGAQDIKVLASVKVRKRTPKEQEIGLLKPAQVRKRKGRGGGEERPA